MAGPERKSNAHLTQLLASEGSRFDFFRAVQLLQRLAGSATPVGELGPPNTEAIRFIHDPRLIFHPSDISSIEPRVVKNGHVHAVMMTNFLGLFGSASPLANYISEDVLRAEENDDSSLRAFYDIFHHRLISLFYRAWKKYRFAAGFRSDASDPFTRRALSFVGVDLVGGISKHGLPPGDLLPLAPLLSSRTRPSRTLQIVLERLLPGINVSIEMFVARRVRLDESQRVLLGKQNSELGLNFTIGRSVLDRSGAFRIVVGPVGYDVFEAFVPGGRHHQRMRQIVDQFSGGILESELELRLSEKESPRFQLGSRKGGILGITTQLITERKKPMRYRMVLSEDAEKAKPEALPDDAEVSEPPLVD